MRLIPILLLILSAAAPAVLSAQERRPNNLLGAQSPYLLQHLYNPVDWYPWGREALDKARAENKLIFVSIGYASCYWCHVMRRESFEDAEIAAILNADFVSIKIDREVRPDLDEQFLLATRYLTGSGGWPNNVILTPEGDPVFGGTYFPPRELKERLLRQAGLWRDDPASLRAEGARVGGFLRDYLTRQAAATELTPDLLARIRAGLLAQMDEFSGGLGTAPKFPREQVFLYLGDIAERTGDREARAAVTALLDGMLAGGIHDQVGGGFHRYAVDPEWHIPHFEKMLYNQANIGLLLIRSVIATGDPAHARALDRMLGYLLREMRAPGGAFYASQDAESPLPEGGKREGAYYLWTPEEVVSALGPRDGAWLNQIFGVDQYGDLEGGNVLHLPAAMPDPARLDPMLERLRVRRADRAPPDTDEKLLLGWNGALIAMLAEAGHALERPALWQAGARAARFLIDRLGSADGYLRMVYAGTAREPAQLPDLAAFALGLIALHDYAPAGADRGAWLAEARRIADLLLRDFGSVDAGLRMSAAPEGISPVIAVDDGELASGNAMTLLVLTRLARRMEAPELIIAADRLAATLSGLAVEDPVERAGALAAILELKAGESGLVRHVAGGAVRVEARPDPEAGEVGFTLTIKPGWHVNAHEPLEDFFIPTDLVVGERPLPADAWPAPRIVTLGFNPEPLALYDGTLTLTAPLPDTRPARARLILQACSDEICLAPEEIDFTLWAPPRKSGQ